MIQAILSIIIVIFIFIIVINIPDMLDNLNIWVDRENAAERKKITDKLLNRVVKFSKDYKKETGTKENYGKIISINFNGIKIRSLEIDFLPSKEELKKAEDNYKKLYKQSLKSYLNEMQQWKARKNG